MRDAGVDAMTISVVVPSIGRPRLRDVLRALRSDPDVDEIVVVADRQRGAVDAIVQATETPGGPSVLVVDGPGRGPAAARQRGIERASGELLVLLDDDVVPCPGLAGAHRAAHAVADRRVVVGPMPVATELCASSAVARLYANDYDAEWNRHLLRPDGVMLDLWGGNVSVRRADALSVPQVGPLGNLRNREDQEWGLRARAAGLTGGVAPDALAAHWHEGTAAGLLDAAADQARTGRRLDAAHPERAPDGDPRAVLPAPARIVVALAETPGLGRAVGASVVAAARRLGDGPPERWRLALLVVARVIVQRAA
jgi:hypothetical protein